MNSTTVRVQSRPSIKLLRVLVLLPSLVGSDSDPASWPVAQPSRYRAVGPSAGPTTGPTGPVHCTAHSAQSDWHRVREMEHKKKRYIQHMRPHTHAACTLPCPFLQLQTPAHLRRSNPVPGLCTLSARLMTGPLAVCFACATLPALPASCIFNLVNHFEGHVDVAFHNPHPRPPPRPSTSPSTLWPFPLAILWPSSVHLHRPVSPSQGPVLLIACPPRIFRTPTPLRLHLRRVLLD